MARIRTTKPEFWTSEQVTDCEPIARLLFLGMWNFADDNGIHPASPKRLKMEVLPADDVTVAEVSRLVAQLVAAKLVREYEVDGERYWQITGWHHQRIDQPTFRYPLPDGSLPNNVRRKFVEDSSNGSANQIHGTSDERSDREGKGREGKGEERKDQVQPTASETPDGDSPPVDLLGKPEKHVNGKKPTLFDTVISVYHETLPKCRRITVRNAKREKRIATADKLARKLCEQEGWTYVPQVFWTAYFGQCKADEWLRGDRPHPHNSNWKQNLDVLLAEDRFAQIMDRAIEEMKEDDQ